MKKICSALIGGLLLSAGLTSCNSEPQYEDTLLTFDFTLNEDAYNDLGYWKDVYDTESLPYFTLYPLGAFTHRAQVDTYDGVEYKSFTGFCPSRVFDPFDHTGEDWTLYQFASAVNQASTGYMIAHWDVRENAQTTLSDRSCLIECFGYTFRPVSVGISNTSYAYWAMKNGTAFSKPFGPEDYLILDIYGVNKGVATLGASVPLAQNGEIVNTWQNVDLTALGEVQQIYFTMRSSDTGQYGMNVPAYFAMNSLQLMLLGNQGF